jgi:hypothetical protein
VTRPAPTTQLRVPAPQDTNEGRLLYIAVLERKVIAYSLREIKMRAALELATGVPYDEVDFSKMSYSDLEEMIAQDIARGLNISIENARERVADNKVISNPD